MEPLKASSSRSRAMASGRLLLQLFGFFLDLPRSPVDSLQPPFVLH
jgi:hypothetical protein